jgi:hypothetical protein
MCHSGANMSRMLKRLPWLLLTVMLAGCASTITNLTPTTASRNASGMYPIEVAWDTQDETVRPNSLKPYVVQDFETYPMRPTLGISNRWETVILIPTNQSFVTYHIRFDYEYNAWGRPRKNSKLSPGYRLEILDR